MLVRSPLLSRRALLPVLTPLGLAARGAYAAARTLPLDQFGDPAADFAGTLTAALRAAARTGAVVEATRGRTYIARSSTRIIDLDVRLLMNGARIIRAAAAPNEPVLVVTHRLEASIAAVVQPAGRSTIRLRDARGWQPGDVGRIVSDDQLPWSDANQRQGESFVVAAVWGNSILTATPLRLDYRNNVRVARHLKRACAIEDFAVEDDPAAPAGRNAPALLLKGTVDALVTRPSFYRLSGEALRIECAHAPRTIGGKFVDLRTSAKDLAFGYGIREVGVTAGVHSNHEGRRLRHLYTSWATTSVKDDDPKLEKYGGVVGSTVSACRVTEPEDDGISTHPDAFGVSLRKIVVEGASHGAITLRGRACHVEACRSSGTGGLTISGNAASGAHVVTAYAHCSMVGDRHTSALIVRGAPSYAGHNTIAARLTGSTGGAPMLVVSDAAVSVRLVVDLTAYAGDPPPVADAKTATLDVTDLCLLAPTSSGDRVWFASMVADTTSTLNVGVLRISTGATERPGRLTTVRAKSHGRIIRIA